MSALLELAERVRRFFGETFAGTLLIVLVPGMLFWVALGYAIDADKRAAMSPHKDELRSE